MAKQLQPLKFGFTGMVMGVFAMGFALAQLMTPRDPESFGLAQALDLIAIAFGLLAIVFGVLGLRRQEVRRLCAIGIIAGVSAIALHFGLLHGGAFVGFLIGACLLARPFFEEPDR